MNHFVIYSAQVSGIAGASELTGFGWCPSLGYPTKWADSHFSLPNPLSTLTFKAYMVPRVDGLCKMTGKTSPTAFKLLKTGLQSAEPATR